MNSLLKIKNTVLSREDKRKMTRECAEIIKRLEKVEIDFCKNLFEENNFTYHELYGHYLDRFLSQVMYIDSVIKLKFIDINTRYFAERYAPIV